MAASIGGGGHGFSRTKNYIYPEALVLCRNTTDNTTYHIHAEEYSCMHFGHCSCPRIHAEPDIAGKGVIAAFVFTALLTLLSTLFCLVVGPHEDRQTFNPIDRVARKRVSAPVRKLMVRGGLSPDVQALVAHDLVNALSDLQLVTGLAILVGGTKQLFDGTISTYHFMIVTDLAWFCTNTHLLSLLVIKTATSARDSVKRTHAQVRHDRAHQAPAARLARALRICLMAVTFALLMYALWVTGYEGIYEEGQYRCPMRCSLDLPKGGLPEALMVINMGMMAYFYAVRIFLSWRTGRVFWMDHVRGSLIDNRGQPVDVLKPEVVFRRWTEDRVLRTLKRLLVGLWYFAASDVQTAVGLTAYFGFGIFAVVDDRLRGHGEMEPAVSREENSLVFSQLVPIFLLIIPFMGLFESYSRHSFSPEANKPAKTKTDEEEVVVVVAMDNGCGSCSVSQQP